MSNTCSSVSRLPLVPDEIVVFECVACGGRGNAPETVRHLILCADPSETVELRFEVGGEAGARPTFGP
jgi:hypothetical protein